MSNFLLYTHILISQKINFVTEVRFSQKRSHIECFMCICKVDKVTNTMSISVGARMSTVAKVRR